MFRIVEDASPPLPEDCSESLQDFLKWCFNKDPAKRPNAEQLCEHDWLKNHSAAHKVRVFFCGLWDSGKLTSLKHLQELRPQDSIPFLRRVSADMQKTKMNVRYLADMEKPHSETAIPTDRRVSQDQGISGSPPARPRLSNGPSSEVSFSPRGEHSFVKTTFGKRT